MLEIGWKHNMVEEQNDDAHMRQGFALALLYSRPYKPQRKHTHIMVGGAVLCFVLVLIWIAGNMYGVRYQLQTKVFPFRTSDAQLVSTIKKQAMAYRITVVQPDGKRQQFSLKAASISIDPATSILQAKAQRAALTQRLMWWHPIPLKLAAHTDTKTLQAFIALHVTTVITPAQDASVNITDGAVHVVDGIAGKQYGLDDPTQTVLEAVSTLRTAPLRMHISKRVPAVTAEALSNVKIELDAALKQSVVFTIDDKKITPDSREIASWIDLAPDSMHKGVDVSVNRENIQKYIDGLAKNNSHPAISQVSLNGTIATVGLTGVKVSGTDDAVNTVANALLAGKGVRVALSVAHTAYQTVRAPTSGKWIEVNITTKRMYVYNDNALQQTFLVSAGKASTPTVTGTFKIYSKYTKKTMRGDDYIQPDVPWVNFFYRDYAIHGNYWRPASYFGAINSSHGCVGLTTSDAAWVYNWAPIGTPVVVHI